MLPQGEHRGPYLFAAKALAPGILKQGLIGTSASICHPSALSTYPSLSQQSKLVPAIRVYFTSAQDIQLNPSLFIITYYYILKSLFSQYGSR